MTSANDAVNKQAVASAFSRAAGSYDAAAALQRDVGERLLGMGSAHPGERLLDAGCGTGYFSRLWRERGMQVTALDLAPGMLDVARQRQAAHHYLLGDIEQVPLPDAAMDICFSSLVVQWCSDLPAALAELYRVTAPAARSCFPRWRRDRCRSWGRLATGGRRAPRERLSAAGADPRRLC